MPQTGDRVFKTWDFGHTQIQNATTSESIRQIASKMEGVGILSGPHSHSSWQQPGMLCPTVTWQQPGRPDPIKGAAWGLLSLLSSCLSLVPRYTSVCLVSQLEGMSGHGPAEAPPPPTRHHTIEHILIFLCVFINISFGAET